VSPQRRMSEEFLFYFVSLAYALSIKEVFPVLFDTAREGYKYIQSLPNLGPLRLAGLLLPSPEHSMMVTPYVDKVVLSLIVLFVWAGYYFLITRLRDVSRSDYSPFYAVVDLLESALLFFTTKSLGNIAEKAIPETDTAWFGLLAVLAIGLLRLGLGFGDIRRPATEGEMIATQNWIRLLMRISHLTCVCITFLFCGYMYGRNLLSVDRVVLSVVWSTLLYTVLVSLTGC
jgi:hypothetical protein